MGFDHDLNVNSESCKYFVLKLVFFYFEQDIDYDWLTTFTIEINEYSGQRLKPLFLDTLFDRVRGFFFFSSCQMKNYITLYGNCHIFVKLCMNRRNRKKTNKKQCGKK